MSSLAESICFKGWFDGPTSHNNEADKTADEWVPTEKIDWSELIKKVACKLFDCSTVLTSHWQKNGNQQILSQKSDNEWSIHLPTNLDMFDILNALTNEREREMIGHLPEWRFL